MIVNNCDKIANTSRLLRPLSSLRFECFKFEKITPVSWLKK